MKIPQLLILLLTILVHVASGFPTDRRAVPGQDKHASWDDVNVVAHGLLQLGQGLKEHVDKTKAQMRDIYTKLKAFNSTMAELEKKQQEQNEAPTPRGGKAAEGREKRVAELAEEVRMKVEEVKKQNEDINSRMDRLEEKVDEVLTGSKMDSNNSDDSGIPMIQVSGKYCFDALMNKTQNKQRSVSRNNDALKLMVWFVSLLQRLVAAQNRQIDQLVEKIKQQQGKLEKQSVHVQALQSKVSGHSYNTFIQVLR